jgi:DNA-binding transcriptional LysR family regulator
MDGISALPLFLAAAEARSFTGAARQLGMSPSATGKAIARLEARLGVALFQRTTRKVRLTEEGELLFERARLIRDEWREAEVLLAEAKAEPRGRLRIALPAIGHRLLSPHLETFTEQYPHIHLDFDQDDRLMDLVAAKIDIAIRSGLLEDSTYRSRRLGDFRFILCAAPNYFAARGMPFSLEDLRHHAQVRFRFPGSERLQPWRLVSSTDAVSGRPAFISTDMEGVLSATLAGLGIAQMPDFLVAHALSSGELVAVLDAQALADAFWLVWPQGVHRSPKVRAFVDFCVGRLLPLRRS